MVTVLLTFIFFIVRFILWTGNWRPLISWMFLAFLPFTFIARILAIFSLASSDPLTKVEASAEMDELLVEAASDAAEFCFLVFAMLQFKSEFLTLFEEKVIFNRPGGLFIPRNGGSILFETKIQI